MADKQFIVDIPEGYEIDKENSTFECIKFKKVEKKWRDDKTTYVTGYYITNTSGVSSCCTCSNTFDHYKLFATEKHVKRALAEARISQIMANDERFGGVITDDEWNNSISIKYCIKRICDKIDGSDYCYSYHFLAFHTAEQRDLFFKENEDLIKDYLMLSTTPELKTQWHGENRKAIANARLISLGDKYYLL